MPTPQFPGVPDYDKNKSTEYNLRQLYDAYIGINRYLTYLLSALDTLNISRLDAKVVNTGVLNTNRVTIRAEDGNKYYQIDGSGIVANNGVENTLEFDLATGNMSIKGIITALAGLIGGWTISGNALVSSTSSYPRVVIDPSNNEIVFYASSTQYVKIGSGTIVTQPFMEFTNGNSTVAFDIASGRFYMRSVGSTDIPIEINGGNQEVEIAGNGVDIDSGNGDVNISGVDINLNPGIGGAVRVQFERFEDPFGTDLQTALDDKADYFTGHTGDVVVGDGLGGQITLKFNNGVLTDVL